MKMDERYSNASYGSAGLVAFLSGLTLNEWGFVIGLAFSIALGILTYRLNRREQTKRTAIIEGIRIDLQSGKSSPSATAQVIADLGQKAPKEI